MDIRRNIFTLKVIGFIFLSTLFITSMSSVPAEATSDCPCNYFSTFKYFKETFRTFHVDVEMCYFKGEEGIEIEGLGSNYKSECAFEFELEGDGDVECEAFLECGLENNVEGGAIVESDWELENESAKACKRELQWIIWLNWIPKCTLS